MSIKIKYLTDYKIRSLPIQNKEALFVCSPKLYVRGFIQMAANILNIATHFTKSSVPNALAFMVQSHGLKPVQQLKNTMGWSERT